MTKNNEDKQVNKPNRAINLFNDRNKNKSVGR